MPDSVLLHAAGSPGKVGRPGTHTRNLSSATAAVRTSVPLTEQPGGSQRGAPGNGQVELANQTFSKLKFTASAAVLKINER
jgi:hypothetical protein